MKSENTYLGVILLTSACLFSSGLLAEDLDEEAAVEALPPLYTSSIELGVGYTSEDSYKFGEYNGLEDEGAHVLGNISVRKRSVIGDEDNNYWSLSGTNLGLDNRNISAEYSHDGTYGNYSQNQGYRFFFEYDAIPHRQFEDGLTPFNGIGTTDLTLPANWVGGTNVPGLTALMTNLKQVDVETERDRFGGGFKWNLADHWKAYGNYRHEDKEGTDPIGIIFGSTGGNPRGSVIPRDISYDVEEFGFGIAYTSDRGQYSIDFTQSLFDNNNKAMLFDNPFNSPVGGAGRAWALGTDFNDGARGQYGYEPDNEAFQVTFSGGYNFTPRIRATGKVSYGQMTQDDSFLPYSSVLAAPIPLPRSDLDGEIDTLYANFALYARLTNRWDAQARYTYDDRDNDTPRDVYVRIPGDSALQGGLDTDHARINLPYSLERHKVELETGYRITPLFKLSAGYDYESKDRNFSEVSNTDEHTAHVRLSANPIEMASGWVKYAHAIRDGSSYASNRPFLSSHNPPYLATLAADDLFENDPLLRKFHLADRDRDQVAANIDFQPLDQLGFNFLAKYNLDDFENTRIGRQESENYNLSFDINYRPIERINSYVYFTHEHYDNDQKGFRRAGDHTFPPGDPRNRPGEDFWTTDNEDRVNTVGTGVDWTVIEHTFDVHMDMAYSRAYTDFDQTGGPLLAGGNVASPLPAVTTRIINFNLSGEYKIREDTSIRMNYLYERFMSTDFGLDNVFVNTLANVILLGNSSPEYREHVVGVSIHYEFE